MRIGVVKETAAGERRVALVPESIRKLVKAGVEVAVQAGAGVDAGFQDDEFKAAGALLSEEAVELIGSADFLLKVNPPSAGPVGTRDEVDSLRNEAMLIASFVPSRNLDLVRKLVERRITAFCTDLIPRITRAQSMDTLSSMSSIAGYKAVLIAANELGKYFPMFMTAAGTVLPAKVFVIGAGVAGLQAIATAKRLGAAVEATDTRPAVKTEVESLGAKFIGVETAEQAQDAGGYAKELSQEFYRKQGELIGERCASSDVVVTTALIGGVKAPKLITEDTVKRMRPGSVIVDLAAVAGGNCELTQPGETVTRHGVRICAPLNLPSEMAYHGSLLFSRNLTAFVLAFWKENKFNFDLNDDILKGATVTHGGQVLHGPTKELLGKA